MLPMIAVVTWIIGMATRKQYQKKGGDDWAVFCIVSFIVSISTIIAMCIIGIVWLDYTEDVIRLEQSITITEEQFQRIAPEITQILNQYAPHEQSVFNGISPSNFNSTITLYAATYPELKANEVFTAIASQVSALLTQIFQLKLEKATVAKNIRLSRRLFTFM